MGAHHKAAFDQFERFLAWRYVRRHDRRRWTAVWWGIALCVLGGLCLVVAIALPDTTRFFDRPPRIALQDVSLGLKIAGSVLLALSNWVLLIAVLLMFFSLFTSVAIFGVYLGTCALVVVLSVMGGFEADLRAKILGTRAHVVVQRSNEQTLHGYHKTLRALDKERSVTGVSPYLEAEVMLTSQSNLAGVVLRGIDPKRFVGVSEIEHFLRQEGSSGSLRNLVDPTRLKSIPNTQIVPMVSPPIGGDDDRDTKKNEAAAATDEVVPPRPLYPGVLIGAEIAKNLRLYVGDDVNLVTPLGGMSPAGPIPRSRPFRVAGIFFSGMYEFDSKMVYVLLPSAQRLLGVDDEITGIEVRAKSTDDAVHVAQSVRQHLGTAYEVRDWRQMNQSLFAALKLEKIVMFAVLAFIVVVAAFAIVITLTMLVLEKTKELAALKALGAGHQSLLKVFVYAGAYIGLIGVVVGLAQGVGICGYLAYIGLPLNPEVYYISRLPVLMSVVDISIIAGATFGLSVTGAIYPAWLAASLRPSQGLHYDG